MFDRRTLTLLAAFIAALVALCVPALIWPNYLDSPIGLIVAIPYLSVYLFHSLGIPGLLQNNGACGWGWCPPSMFGWGFLCTFWLAVLWLLARGVSRCWRLDRPMMEKTDSKH